MSVAKEKEIAKWDLVNSWYQKKCDRPGMIGSD